ncbi:hypothetical protein PAHAL_2G235300 [Panicum hallii]|uniref:Uncharacterized protein n=1 Tax=Panicum hallii TaxID=206008 RepID=A0A2T8KQ54_9POAL|nr:hypothetical protein PAHAL_2G235300 [Panicum hallii]
MMHGCAWTDGTANQGNSSIFFFFFSDSHLLVGWKLIEERRNWFSGRKRNLYMGREFW